ncbi:MAG: S8 family peptidase [Saprospiraceae bacterium]
MYNPKKVLLSIFVLIVILFSITPPSLAQDSSDDTFIILFDENTPETEIQNLRIEFNSTEVWKSTFSNIRIWKVNYFPFTLSSTGEVINDINEGVEAADERPSVDGTAEDYVTNIPSIEKGPSSPTNKPSRCNPNIKMESHTNIGPDFVSFKIAIFDTGIANIGSANSDYDYSLFNGDYTGYDFVNEDGDPNDDHGHGTHIASIISKFEDNDLANAFNYYIYKTHDQNGVGNLSSIVKALDEAMVQGVDIINMSFSYQKAYNSQLQVIENSPLAHQIKIARSKGILILASAGNANNDNDGDSRYYPASFDADNIISVASSNCGKYLSSFSNYGLTTVDLATAGESIPGVNHLGEVVLKSGTSQACALTTKASMILAKKIGDMKWSRIKCRLIKGAEVPNNEIQTTLLGGILNLDNALAMPTCNVTNTNNGNGPDLSFKKTSLPDFTITNPVHSTIELQYPSTKDFNLELSLWNLSGQQLTTYSDVQAQNISIPVAAYPAGIYLLKIRDQVSGEHMVKKIIKQ